MTDLHIFFSVIPSSDNAVSIEVGGQRHLLSGSPWRGVSSYVRENIGEAEQICIEVAKGGDRFFCEVVSKACGERFAVITSEDDVYTCCFPREAGTHIIARFVGKYCVSASFTSDQYSGSINSDVAHSHPDQSPTNCSGCCTS